MLRRLCTLLVPLAAAVLLAAAPASSPNKAQLDEQKAALAKIQKLVGQWRGTGQPQRGSTRGSWIEQADWAWKFTAHSAALTAQLTDGKPFAALELQAGEKAGEYKLLGTLPKDGGSVTYRGTLADDGKLTLTAAEPRDKPLAGAPARIALRFVAGGDRLLVLYERQGAVGDQFVRLAEVGYTRQGSDFGKGSTGPECIVTGGLGTIEVSHDGKTNHVCCTGCRDYFNDNPAQAIAEYQARQAAKKN
jgi:hypothetical protein